MALMVLFQLRGSWSLTGLMRENHRGENSQETAGKLQYYSPKNNNKPLKTPLKLRMNPKKRRLFPPQTKTFRIFILFYFEFIKEVKKTSFIK